MNDSTVESSVNIYTLEDYKFKIKLEQYYTVENIKDSDWFSIKKYMFK